MENHIAKHFALQLGSLISLYLSLGFFLALVFGLINALFPDVTDSVWSIESNASMVRFGFAMTIVFFPTYLYLTRKVNQNRRNSSDGMYLGLTKWLIYLSLLVGGAVLLGNLVAVIMGFLEGELTQRFILKAGSVFIIAGAAFFYYLKDAQGYWLQREKQSVQYGGVASVVLFGVLAVSLAYIQTPEEVRERNIDQQVVSDLQVIQWRIESHYERFQELPSDLEVLYSEIPAEDNPPTAPEGRSSYMYELTSSGFNLCAEFAHTALNNDGFYPYYRHGEEGLHIVNLDDWYYEAGEWCFERGVSL